MPDRPILLTRRGEFDRILANRPLLTSAPLGWPGITLEYRHSSTGRTMPELVLPWHCLFFVCQAASPISMERLSNGRQWHGQVDIGEANIIPASVSYGADWEAAADYIVLFLEPADLAQAIDPTQAPEQIELSAQFSTPDPLLYQLAMGLKEIVATGAVGQRLYAETLSHALNVHLLQKYTTRRVQPRVYEDGLAQAKLAYVIDYIQSHLNSDLSLKELAGLLQLSPHYFAHLFRQATGVAPHQYVIQQRVERAKRLLRQPDSSIAAIAQQVGFAHQAHLTRHFKRLVGVTPGVFQRES